MVWTPVSRHVQRTHRGGQVLGADIRTIPTVFCGLKNSPPMASVAEDAANEPNVGENASYHELSWTASDLIQRKPAGAEKPDI